MTTMTPDQFFDELDKLFGTDNGYVNHLKDIIDLKHLKEDMEENWLSEEDVSAQVDPLYEEIKNTKKNAMKQVHKLNKQNKELKKQIDELKEKLDEGTEQHLADTKKLNKFYMKTKEEIKKLKQELIMQQGSYDFLKATTVSKTMDTSSTDDIIKLEQENKELKEKLKTI